MVRYGFLKIIFKHNMFFDICVNNGTIVYFGNQIHYISCKFSFFKISVHCHNHFLQMVLWWGCHFGGLSESKIESTFLVVKNNSFHYVLRTL